MSTQPHPRWSDDPGHHRRIMDTLIIAVPKATMRVVSLNNLSNHATCISEKLMYPCEDAALGEQTPVHALPANAVILHNGLVGNPKSTASSEAPICGVQSD
jgi:hypothetical protein